MEPTTTPAEGNPDFPQPQTHHTIVSLDQSSEERVLGAIGTIVQSFAETQAHQQIETLRIQLDHQRQMTQAHHSLVLKLAWPALALVAATIAGCLWLQEPRQAVELMKVIAFGFAGLGLRSVLKATKPSGKDSTGG